VPRQCRPNQNRPWGPKLPQVQNLGDGFVVFFLGGQNRNFEKVMEQKVQQKNHYYMSTKFTHYNSPINIHIIIAIFTIYKNKYVISQIESCILIKPKN